MTSLSALNIGVAINFWFVAKQILHGHIQILWCDLSLTKTSKQLQIIISLYKSVLNQSLVLVPQRYLAIHNILTYDPHAKWNRYDISGSFNPKTNQQCLLGVQIVWYYLAPSTLPLDQTWSYFSEITSKIFANIKMMLSLTHVAIIAKYLQINLVVPGKHPCCTTLPNK